MDLAYNQHDHASGRRKFHSAGNLSHLSLAPLTSRLPIHDHHDDYHSYDATVPPPPHTTYLQGKSAPTTPRLLSRSPPRRSASASSSARRNARLPKSKSATHLGPHAAGRSAAHAAGARNAATAVASPATTSSRRNHPHHSHSHNHSHLHSHHHNGGAGSFFAPATSDYSDWLLRAGALISSEARESKGQSWLVSRASSTSLAGDSGSGSGRRRDDGGGMDLGAFGVDGAAAAASAAASPVQSRFGSRSHSRVGSRSHSRVGSRSVLVLTPAEQEQQRFAMVGGEDDFGGAVSVWEEEAEEEEEKEEEKESMISGPDFVNLNEKLEHAEIEVDTSAEDEAYVRRLVKRGNGGVGAWLGNVLGLGLFSVEEDEEESGGDDGETTEGEADEDAASQDMDTRLASMRRLEAITTAVDIPPPMPDEGGWHDAAWLLTVASKVLL